MSYDLRIWTTLPPKLGDLRLATTHEQPRPRAGWDLHIGEAAAVEPEDVPEEIAEALPGVAFVVDVSLQPINAPRAGQQALRKIATAIAREAHGAIEDPQAGEVTLGKGVRRYTALPADDDASLLSMCFWFASGPLIEPAGAPGLLDVLSTCLPEAVPARYGKFEPPANRLAALGRDHLVAFMQQNWHDGGVYYPSPPVAHFHLSIPQQVGATRMGYRSGLLAIDVAAGALAQPGWQAAVLRLWRELVRFVQPFYSDVRHLHHYTRARGRHWYNARTDRHPVCSWWWSGIPVAGPVCAQALGEPYIGLWPTFATAAERIGACLTHAAPSWLPDAPALEIQPPPIEVQQVAPEYRPSGRERQYPVAWPFGPARA
jgi:hypothetical protein